MPKFNKTVDELENRFDKWLYVIRNLNRLDRVPDKLRERIFEKLFQVAEIAKFTPEQIRSYENSLKYYRDINASLDTKYEEGIEKGIEKVAKKMIKENETIEKIIKFTELTKEQIIHLKEKIKSNNM